MSWSETWNWNKENLDFFWSLCKNNISAAHLNRVWAAGFGFKRIIAQVYPKQKFLCSLLEKETRCKLYILNEEPYIENRCLKKRKSNLHPRSWSSIQAQWYAVTNTRNIRLSLLFSIQATKTRTEFIASVFLLYFYIFIERMALF